MTHSQNSNRVCVRWPNSWPILFLVSRSRNASQSDFSSWIIIYYLLTSTKLQNPKLALCLQPPQKINWSSPRGSGKGSKPILKGGVKHSGDVFSKSSRPAKSPEKRPVAAASPSVDTILI